MPDDNSMLGLFIDNLMWELRPDCCDLEKGSHSVIRRPEKLVLNGEKAEIVSDIFERLFHQSGWDPDSLKSTFRALPSALKLMEFEGEFKQTPASIFRHAYAVLPHWSERRHDMKIVDLDQYRMDAA